MCSSWSVPDVQQLKAKTLNGLDKLVVEDLVPTSTAFVVSEGSSSKMRLQEHKFASVASKSERNTVVEGCAGSILNGALG